MHDIAPIRALDEAAALEWLRRQPGRRTNLPAAELGRQWGWQRQRASWRLKAWQKASLVTRCGNVTLRSAQSGCPDTPETSRGKSDHLPRTPVGFTTPALDGWGLRDHTLARPTG
jgi:hypothetical protein